MRHGVPVLREDDVLEALRQSVDRRDDGVAIRHGEAAALAEIILDIDDDQRGARVNRGLFLGHGLGSCCENACACEDASAVELHNKPPLITAGEGRQPPDASAKKQ